MPPNDVLGNHFCIVQYRRQPRPEELRAVHRARLTRPFRDPETEPAGAFCWRRSNTSVQSSASTISRASEIATTMFFFDEANCSTQSGTAALDLTPESGLTHR